MRQQQINEKFNTEFNIPVFYFTELMGIAFGVEGKKLGIDKHITEVNEFLNERDLV
jgi:heterodisulfide reductase subunit B